MSEQKEIKKVAVIMAGGVGIRLWPRSTEKKPKQFIHILGDGTMIQNTVNRLMKVFLVEDIYIVSSNSQKELLFEQLPEIPEENFIIEPFGRNTAPCLALSLIKLGQKYGPDTIMAAFPSDHMIYNKGEFYNSLEVAGNVAYDTHGLVTIGLQPSRPETGFGYLQYKSDIDPTIEKYYNEGVRCTTTFAEKPDMATAQRFIDSGDFLWNSGIFIWRFDAFWTAMDKYMPEESSLFKILNSHCEKSTFPGVLEHTYRQISSESVDYAIMEKAENVYVIKASFGWSDVGTWDEVYRLSRKDARDNVIEGDVIPINISNCYVSSNEKMIGIVGVNDLIVIDSPDALLICSKKRSDEVKEIIDFMRRKQINQFI